MKKLSALENLKLNLFLLKWLENYNPRMTKYLCRKKAFSDRKVIVVDVGAGGLGGNALWVVYGDQMELIGFEPNEKECRRLNQLMQTKGQRFFPIALHRDRGKRKFYITAYNESCGFYRNSSFMSRFPDEANIKVESVVEMDTTDFDSFAHEHGIEWVDFMKIDVEGAELDVLQGSKDYLSNGVLGVKVEVRFHESSHQPVFNEVDAYMRQLGFRLFNLDIYRGSRKALPEVLQHKDDKGRLIPGPTKRGQILWADALYFRDAVAEIKSRSNHTIFQWNKNTVLKLATLLEIYNLSDCAIELLQECRNIIPDVDHLINLLTPPFRGRFISYEEYCRKISLGKNPESLIGELFKAFRKILVLRMPEWMKSIIKPILKLFFKEKRGS